MTTNILRIAACGSLRIVFLYSYDFNKHCNFVITFYIKKLLTHHTQNRSTSIINKLNKSGVYQLTCPHFNMKYIGQTGRSFLTRYQENFRDYKYYNRGHKLCNVACNALYWPTYIDNLLFIFSIFILCKFRFLRSRTSKHITFYKNNIGNARIT
jgi:hypothetical protein